MRLGRVVAWTVGGAVLGAGLPEVGLLTLVPAVILGWWMASREHAQPSVPPWPASVSFLTGWGAGASLVCIYALVASHGQCSETNGLCERETFLVGLAVGIVALILGLARLWSFRHERAS